ncbi:MBL fold metallo-hydrolase [Leptospira borgpetersenii]|uniref:Beta-lactamase family protein n=3 Tax=Leptospira borgpetersenii TaxID=174 RepID=M3H0G8_LEPBO|nr:MBL fold metallo-hydrolase [Leptospira borgpetersenii]EMG00574.1 beta-lactamase family protein [Leptospira borgpetersenii str. 200701203]EKP14608.1 beta-lactamase family protein [Leptospira borgpetersenii str. 200801926]EMN13406.1 beta-lactamase family protein [Leptospira borgpetersenii str. Brem 307]EMN19263.1 beta-lactamase family protein [Leptospira borgpetersenii str. Brem 328]ENO64139.1 beta-lactamase family protein [Leptospira borgpetersenii serovar Mini str. 201000851]
MNNFLLFLTIVFLFQSCFPIDPERIRSPHFQDGKYHNVEEDERLNKSFFSVLRWKILGPADPPAVEGNVEKIPEVISRKKEDFLAPPGKVRIIWLGHATVWIATNFHGKRTHIITDPIFTGVPPFVKRLTELPIQPENLPGVDIVSISHAHRDHLDIDSIKKIQKLFPEVTIHLPSGMREFAKDEGFENTVIQEWWTVSEYAGTKIHFLPAKHWSRMGLTDMNQYHWGSYAFEFENIRIYFGGDTGFSKHFSEIGERFPQGFTATLLPIGAFKPRWFMEPAHIGPKEALEASTILRSSLFLPIHWGTFTLGDDRPFEAALYLKKLHSEKKDSIIPLKIWAVGEIVDL